MLVGVGWCWIKYTWSEIMVLGVVGLCWMVLGGVGWCLGFSITLKLALTTHCNNFFHLISKKLTNSSYAKLIIRISILSCELLFFKQFKNDIALVRTLTIWGHWAAQTAPTREMLLQNLNSMFFSKLVDIWRHYSVLKKKVNKTEIGHVALKTRQNQHFQRTVYISRNKYKNQKVHFWKHHFQIKRYTFGMAV